MNTPDDNTMHPDDDSLRWSLRGLRRESLPRHDLWPAIAARIAATPESVPQSPAGWRRVGPLAIAASFALAIGLAWQLRPLPDTTREQPEARLISAEAAALTREYQAALREVRTAAPAADADALRELDRSAAQIRTALARDPDARFLLERLQDTYARRLALTQRLALT